MAILRTIGFGILAITLTVLMATDAFAASRATAARSMINGIVKEAGEILSDDNLPLKIREQRFYASLNDKFDFIYITKFVIGPDWETLPEVQKKELLTLFRNFFLRAYGSQFGGYPEDSCIIVSAVETGSTDSFVLTRLIRPQRPAVSVRWRLRETAPGEQKIIDLMINGTSVSLAHHESFYRVIHKSGIRRLITLLKIREQKLTAETLDFDDGTKLYQAGKFSEAFAVWRGLADKGNAKAAFNIAAMYAEGRGVVPDKDKAEFWNNKALESGYPPALHNHALDLLARNEDTAAVALLEKAGAKSFAPSWHTLGKIYQYGSGVKKDQKKAFHYIYMAAKAGFARSQYSLGKFYRDGTGTKADQKLANQWFEAAARQGYGRAQDRLAARYAVGRGPEEYIEGLKWAILANQNGIEGAAEKEFFFRSRMSEKAIEDAEKLAAAFQPEQN